MQILLVLFNSVKGFYLTWALFCHWITKTASLFGRVNMLMSVSVYMSKVIDNNIINSNTIF